MTLVEERFEMDARLRRERIGGLWALAIGTAVSLAILAFGWIASRSPREQPRYKASPTASAQVGSTR